MYMPRFNADAQKQMPTRKGDKHHAKHLSLFKKWQLRKVVLTSMFRDVEGEDRIIACVPPLTHNQNSPAFS